MNMPSRTTEAAHQQSIALCASRRASGLASWTLTALLSVAVSAFSLGVAVASNHTGARSDAVPPATSAPLRPATRLLTDEVSALPVLATGSGSAGTDAERVQSSVAAYGD